jgi:hypothetical protein
MRETIRSLRIYFILSGLASLWLGLVGLATDLQVGISPATIAAGAIGIVSVALALAFLYVGISLPGLLRNSSHGIVILLYVSAGWSILTSSLSLLNGLQGRTIAFLTISLLILWYLLKNVRRLAAEAQNTPPKLAQ